MTIATKEQEVSLDVIRELLGAEPPAQSITWINSLFYGEPGAGKTYLLGTAQDHPDTKPFLLFDVEGGSVTLRSKKDVDVVQIRSMQQLEDAINELIKNPGYYKTVGVDSLTELQKLDMRTLMVETKKAKPDSTDIYVPSPREWGKSGERIRLIVRALRDLPCNTLMTALLGVDSDEKSPTRGQMYPLLPGKLRHELPGFFDIVGLLRALSEKGEDDENQIIRTLQVVKTDKVVAKDRTSALGSLVRAPSIPLMWEMIHDS